MSTMKVKALVPVLGSNRMLASHVGEALNGCVWVGIPFVGGFSEVPYITARTIVANDLHRHIINLARIAADSLYGPMLYRRLRRIAFHPDSLAKAQLYCRAIESGMGTPIPLEWAENYFVSAWMNRSGKAGTKDEFSGRLALRFNANGGDSAKRYANAARGLMEWRHIIGNGRCTFSTIDAFEFNDRCEDNEECALYEDPPFFGPGVDYKHNCGDTETEQVAWHTRLRDSLMRFKKTRIVCRFYDVPLIRELYPEPEWTWKRLVGRKQTNDDAPEVLLVRNR